MYLSENKVRQQKKREEKRQKRGAATAACERTIGLGNKQITSHAPPAFIVLATDWHRVMMLMEQDHRTSAGFTV